MCRISTLNGLNPEQILCIFFLHSSVFPRLFAQTCHFVAAIAGVRVECLRTMELCQVPQLVLCAVDSLCRCLVCEMPLKGLRPQQGAPHGHSSALSPLEQHGLLSFHLSSKRLFEYSIFTPNCRDFFPLVEVRCLYS